MDQTRVNYLIELLKTTNVQEDYHFRELVKKAVTDELDLGDSRKKVEKIAAELTAKGYNPIVIGKEKNEVKECAEIIFDLFKFESERQHFNKLTPEDKLSYIRLAMGALE